MAETLFAIALVPFAIGFVALLTGTLMRRLPVRLFGMFCTGTSFLLMTPGFLLSGPTTGNILFGLLALYFGIDTYVKAFREKRAAALK